MSLLVFQYSLPPSPPRPCRGLCCSLPPPSHCRRRRLVASAIAALVWSPRQAYRNCHLLSPPLLPPSPFVSPPLTLRCPPGLSDSTDIPPLPFAVAAIAAASALCAADVDLLLPPRLYNGTAITPVRFAVAVTALSAAGVDLALPPKNLQQNHHCVTAIEASLPLPPSLLPPFHLCRCVLLLPPSTLLSAGQLPMPAPLPSPTVAVLTAAVTPPLPAPLPLRRRLTPKPGRFDATAIAPRPSSPQLVDAADVALLPLHGRRRCLTATTIAASRQVTFPLRRRCHLPPSTWPSVQSTNLARFVAVPCCCPDTKHMPHAAVVATIGAAASVAPDTVAMLPPLPRCCRHCFGLGASHRSIPAPCCQPPVVAIAAAAAPPAAILRTDVFAAVRCRQPCCCRLHPPSSPMPCYCRHNFSSHSPSKACSPPANLCRCHRCRCRPISDGPSDY